ncbi:intermembrane space protein sorting protein [Schizosaccharomyces japonicus yFS275]|uniref:Intermembrane space protein sorting protein n=1 Tax=Schizosaccharomyces japonicus (strain yFS275 / FY16936) TaxID=402676 RepID=B6JW09_SCHJY|nr:intermembrane space protein sorting protein [Schizosaccharomyces japonicus yFS275]EEB05560.1 intermembrane space protein sorting protein [Schizosaccharomyces japonicus yFS275]
MKFFENCHLFNYPFSHVSAAHWQKYPNEWATQVYAIDTLKQFVIEGTQTLYTERLITCRQSIPRWIRKITGNITETYFLETSKVDLATQTFIIKSTNLTFNEYLNVVETVTYKKHPELEETTVFQQQATIQALVSLKRLANYVEDYSVSRFKQNAKKGKLGFDSVLARPSPVGLNSQERTNNTV